MSEKPSGLSQDPLEIPKVLTAADVLRDLRGDIAVAGGDRRWRDTREAWLGRAATRLRQPFQRIKSLWYDDRSNPTAVEYLSIRRAAAALRASNSAALETAYENDARITGLLAGAGSGVVSQQGRGAGDSLERSAGGAGGAGDGEGNPQ